MLYQITPFAVLHLLRISYLPWPVLATNLQTVSTIISFLDYRVTTYIVGHSSMNIVILIRPQSLVVCIHGLIRQVGRGWHGGDQCTGTMSSLQPQHFIGSVTSVLFKIQEP